MGDNADHLAEVPGEYHQRSGDVRQRHIEADGGEQVIGDLKIYRRRVSAVYGEHPNEQPDKKQVDKYKGRYLHYGQQRYIEDHLFHEEGFFHDAAAHADQRVREKEPGDHAGREPEDKGSVVDGHGAEAEAENEPHDADRKQGLEYGPGQAQYRAGVALL